jgi:hypothetical protein
MKHNAGHVVFFFFFSCRLRCFFSGFGFGGFGGAAGCRIVGSARYGAALSADLPYVGVGIDVVVFVWVVFVSDGP